MAEIPSQVRQFFTNYDREGRGFIDQATLRRILEDIKYPDAASATPEVMKRLDLNRDGLISIEEFSFAFTQSDFFNSNDEDDDSSPPSRSSPRRMSLQDYQATQFFKEVDSNQDGELDDKEIDRMLRLLGATSEGERAHQKLLLANKYKLTPTRGLSLRDFLDLCHTADLAFPPMNETSLKSPPSRVPGVNADRAPRGSSYDSSPVVSRPSLRDETYGDSDEEKESDVEKNAGVTVDAMLSRDLRSNGSSRPLPVENRASMLDSDSPKIRTLKQIFSLGDTNKRGVISCKELKTILEDPHLGVGTFLDNQVTLGLAKLIMRQLDLSGDGLLQFNEFSAAFGHFVNEDGSFNDNAQSIERAEVRALMAENREKDLVISDLQSEVSELKRSRDLDISSMANDYSQREESLVYELTGLTDRFHTVEHQVAALERQLKEERENNLRLETQLRSNSASLPSSRPMSPHLSFSKDDSIAQNAQIARLSQENDRLRSENESVSFKYRQTLRELENAKSSSSRGLPEIDSKSQVELTLLRDAKARLESENRSLNALVASLEAEGKALKTEALRVRTSGVEQGLRSDIEEKERQIVDLKAENSKLRELFSSSSHAEDEAQTLRLKVAKMDALQSEIDRLRKSAVEAIEMKAQNDSQKRKLGVLEGDKKSMQEEIDRLNRELDKARHEGETLQAAIAALNASSEASDDEMASLSQQLRNADASLSAKTAECKTQQDELARTRAQLDAANAALSRWKEQSDTLKGQYASTQSQAMLVPTLQIEVSELKAQLDNLNGVIAYQKKQMADLADLDAEVSSLRTKAAKFDAVQTELTKLRNAAVENVNLKGELDALKRKVTLLGNEKQALQTELDRLNASLSSLQASHDSLSLSSASMTQRIADHQSEASMLQAKCEDLQSQLDRRIVENRSLNDVAARLRQDNEQMNTAMVRHKETVDTLKAQLVLAQQQKEKVLELENALRAANEKHAAESAQLKLKVEDFEELENEVQNLRLKASKVDALNTELQRLRQAATENTMLKADIESLKRKYTNESARSSSLEAQVTALHGDHQASLSELELAKANLISAQSHAEELEETNNELQQKLRDATQQLEAKNGELQRARFEANLAQQQTTKAQEEAAGLKDQLKKSIDKTAVIAPMESEIFSLKAELEGRKILESELLTLRSRVDTLEPLETEVLQLRTQVTRVDALNKEIDRLRAQSAETSMLKAELDHLKQKDQARKKFALNPVSGSEEGFSDDSQPRLSAAGGNFGKEGQKIIEMEITFVGEPFSDSTKMAALQSKYDRVTDELNRLKTTPSVGGDYSVQLETLRNINRATEVENQLIKKENEELREHIASLPHEEGLSFDAMRIFKGEKEELEASLSRERHWREMAEQKVSEYAGMENKLRGLQSSWSKTGYSDFALLTLVDLVVDEGLHRTNTDNLTRSDLARLFAVEQAPEQPRVAESVYSAVTNVTAIPQVVQYVSPAATFIPPPQYGPSPRHNQTMTYRTHTPVEEFAVNVWRSPLADWLKLAGAYIFVLSPLELALYSKHEGVLVASWPMTDIPRYGVDENVFSFEVAGKQRMQGAVYLATPEAEVIFDVMKRFATPRM